MEFVRVTRVVVIPVVLAAIAGGSRAESERQPADALRLEPVVVTATRSDLATTAAGTSTTVLDQRDVETSANVAVDDVLRTIPGFSLYRRSSSMVTSPNLDPEAQGVTLRGIGPSGASRALVLVDGVPLVDGFDGTVNWSKVPKDSIERIEVMRGAGASLWGNYAMAGVINIFTRQPTSNGAAVKATYGTHGLTDDSVALSGRHGDFTLGLGGDFFNTDGFNTTRPDQRGPIDGESSSRHETFNGRVGYAVGPDASVSLHGQYFDEEHRDGTHLRHSSTNAGLIDLSGVAHTDDGSDWRLGIFSRLQSFDIQFSEADALRTTEHRTLYQETPYTDVGGSLVWSRVVQKRLLVTAGLDLHFIDGENRDAHFDEAGCDVEERQRARGKQLLTGIFVQSIYTPAERWEFALGGRVDVWTNYDGRLDVAPDDAPASRTAFASKSEASFSPRLSALYRAARWVSLRAAAYRAFRAPTMAELYRRSEVEELQILNNPSLSAEHLNGAEGGVDLPLLDNLDIRATGFWNEVEDPIVNVDTQINEEGVVTERTRKNLGLARTVGAEVEGVYEPLPHVTLSGSYLFADATLTQAAARRGLLPDEAENGEPILQLKGKRLAQIPRHAFTTGARYDNPEWFTIGLEGRFVDDQYEDAENRERLPNFFILNGYLSRRLPVIDGEVFLAAENLLDRQYIVDRGGGIFKNGTPLMGYGGVRARF